MKNYLLKVSRYELLDRSQRILSGLPKDLALLVLRGAKGAGKSTLMHQILESRISNGYDVIETSSKTIESESLQTLEKKITDLTTYGTPVILAIPKIDSVEGTDFVTKVVSLLENNALLSIIVTGSNVQGLDGIDVALRVPTAVIDDEMLKLTAAETITLAKLRNPQIDIENISAVFDLANGWVALTHRLVIRTAPTLQSGYYDKEATVFTNGLLKQFEGGLSKESKRLLVLFSLINEISNSQLRELCSIGTFSAELESFLQPLLPLLSVKSEGEEKVYVMHQLLRKIVWEQKSRFVDVSKFNEFVKAHEQYLPSDKSRVWSQLSLAFESHDWALVNRLMVENFSEQMVVASPLFRAQLQSTPDVIKEKYPILNFASTLEKIAFPQGGLQRVFQKFSEMAKTKYNTMSLMVGIDGIVATGIRLVSARISGQSEVFKNMVPQLIQRMEELTADDAEKYRTILVTLRTQVALSYMFLEQYDLAEKWCRNALNLLPAESQTKEINGWSLYALILARRGDIKEARALIAQGEKTFSGMAWKDGHEAVNYWLAKGIVQVEQGLWKEAEETFGQFSWRIPTNEMWPIMLWINAHIHEHKHGAGEAFSWLRSEVNLREDAILLPQGPKKMLDNLLARLAWKSGRYKFFKNTSSGRGLLGVYHAVTMGDFRRAQVLAAAAVNEAGAMGDYRMRGSALLLRVVAEHELAFESEQGSRAQALKYLESYELQTPKLERPAWWDTDRSEERTPISSMVKSEGSTQPVASARKAAGVLSRAEIRTLRAVSEAGTTNAAAEKLHLSVHTIRDQMKSVYKKLGVRTREDAIRVAASSGLLNIKN